MGEIFIYNQERKTLEESIKCINIAKKYDRYNPEYSNREAFVFYIAQDFDESVKQFEELIALQPLKLANYEDYSSALMSRAEEEYKSGGLTQAGNDFKKIIKLESLLKSVKEKLSPFAFKLKHTPELTLSPKLSYNISEAYYYLQDIEKARYYAKIALKDTSFLPMITELKNRFEKNN